MSQRSEETATDLDAQKADTTMRSWVGPLAAFFVVQALNILSFIQSSLGALRAAVVIVGILACAILCSHGMEKYRKGRREVAHKDQLRSREIDAAKNSLSEVLKAAMAASDLHPERQSGDTR